MAKRHKTAAIRKVLETSPASTVKEKQAALAAKRIKASVALIYQVKGKKRGVRSNGHVSMDGLLAAKAKVAKLGSVDAARDALTQFAKLMRKRWQEPFVLSICKPRRALATRQCEATFTRELAEKTR